MNAYTTRIKLNTMEPIEAIWDIARQAPQSTQIAECSNKECQDCNSDNLYVTSHEIVCSDCGLVQNTYISNCQFNVPFDNQSEQQSTKRVYTTGKSKLMKMQEWNMWTNEEKNEYKLANYTKTLCRKLEINEGLTSSITETVVEVMNVIKKHDGTKRARVKDGIILTCIQYVSKNSGNYISAIDVAKKINLEIKYVTKAEKIILELLANKKLKLDKSKVLETLGPFQYVMNVVRKKALKIPEVILDQVKKLIELCEKNDLLLDHTPLSIGVCCFYYILKAKEIELDVKLFSELYDLSVVTVIKTYNKLKNYDDFITKEMG